MASFNKFNDFVEQLGLKVHNLNTDTLKVALVRSDAAAGAGSAPQASDTKLGDMVKVTVGTGYADIDVANAWSESGGTATLVGDQCVFTATAGDWQSFRYVVLYNDDDTSGPDKVIGYWDYATDLTLGNGETFTVKFNNQTSGGTILTLA